MLVKQVVRWKDKDGKEHKKMYDTDYDAKRAEKWLEEHGAEDIYRSVFIPKIPDNNQAMFPTIQPANRGYKND